MGTRASRWISLWTAVAAVALVGTAPPARAGQLTIEFDFTSSVVSLGMVSIPPDGSLTAASATLTLPASGSATVSAGPVRLESFLVAGTIDFFTGFLNLTHITGSFTMSLNGTGLGTFNATSDTALITRDFRAFLGLRLDCSGILLCGNFPISANGSGTLNNTFPFAIQNVSVPGAASIATTLTVTLNGGGTAMFDIQGIEVSRTFVPEPDRLALLGAGVAALFSLGALRARGPRRRP